MFKSIRVMQVSIWEWDADEIYFFKPPKNPGTAQCKLFGLFQNNKNQKLKLNTLDHIFGVQLTKVFVAESVI